MKWNVEFIDNIKKFFLRLYQSARTCVFIAKNYGLNYFNKGA